MRSKNTSNPVADWIATLPPNEARQLRIIQGEDGFPELWYEAPESGWLIWLDGGPGNDDGLEEDDLDDEAVDPEADRWMCPSCALKSLLAYWGSGLPGAARRRWSACGDSDEDDHG